MYDGYPICYGPMRLFKPPDALAMHKFGHRQGSATMHQWFGEWSATFVSNRHASPRHRDIEKKINACIEIFSQCFDAKYHRRYIAEQRRAVGEHSAMYTKVKNVPDTSVTHRRHIGDDRVNIGDTCSISYYRRWFGDLSLIHRRCSPMFPSCSAKHWWCYGDASLSVRNLFSDWSPMITWALL